MYDGRGEGEGWDGMQWDGMGAEGWDDEAEGRTREEALNRDEDRD